jgi:hypothetical protein
MNTDTKKQQRAAEIAAFADKCYEASIKLGDGSINKFADKIIADEASGPASCPRCNAKITWNEGAAYCECCTALYHSDALMQHTLSELERYIQRCHRLGKKVLHGAHRQWDASLIRHENQRNN